LTPGRYYLSASDRRGSMPRLEMLRPGMPGGRAAGGSEEAYATIYYPGTIDPASAAPMDIRPGTEMRGIELRLAKRRVVRVRGRVDGALARRPVVVSLVPASTFSVLERRNATSRDGTFELINVAPGSYILTAQSNEGQTRTYARTALEVGESPIDNVSLTLQPAFTVTGRFRLQGLSPAETPNMRILLRPSTPGLQFPAPFGPGGGPGGPGVPGGRGAPQPQTQPDGTFTLHGVVADKFQVVVERLPEGAYLKSVRVGEQDVLQNGLDLSAGPPGAMLDVVISMDAGVVNGIVTNEAGDPVSGATVTLAPEDSRVRQASLYRQTTTIENGAFVIKGIAPGSYRVLAWEELDPLSWQDPEYLRSHERFAKSVAIREKQAESLQIKWVPAEK
ncbi:MAG: carboxypeptidase regulatory-like domain-containing protein, partial [Bryobacteraceae bacterium]